MKDMKRFLKDEEGNVLIIFAGSMILIAFFLGILIDVSMIYMDNNAMQNLLQIIREERFTHQDTIRYSNNPAVETYMIARESAMENGFDGEIKVYFKEEVPETDRSFRSYKVKILLRKESPFYFGRIFGLDTIALGAGLDGGESYGDGSLDVIWYPPMNASGYNGSYLGNMAEAGYIYNNLDDTPPGGW
ncbi:MAG TPA: hypothetical protein VFD17_02160 [Clostridia bacterium]|nr:hypothetical protein [Clostridia bacterium]